MACGFGGREKSLEFLIVGYKSNNIISHNKNKNKRWKRNKTCDNVSLLNEKKIIIQSPFYVIKDHM